MPVLFSLTSTFQFTSPFCNFSSDQHQPYLPVASRIQFSVLLKNQNDIFPFHYHLSYYSGFLKTTKIGKSLLMVSCKQVALLAPAWEIPWTEKPGKLQSMGVPKVGYNLATKPPTTLFTAPLLMENAVNLSSLESEAYYLHLKHGNFVKLILK